MIDIGDAWIAWVLSIVNYQLNGMVWKNTL